MNGKQKKALKQLFENNHISIKSFLMCYCGIYSNQALSNKVTHDDIKVLLPYLKRKSFEYVLKNLCEVYTGDIILVSDALGNIVPYVKPKIKNISEAMYVCCEVREEQNNDFENIDLDKLSKYELIELRRKYKSNQKIECYGKICRLIKEKKDPKVKRYHKNKEKLIMKGRLEND